MGTTRWEGIPFGDSTEVSELDFFETEIFNRCDVISSYTGIVIAEVSKQQLRAAYLQSNQVMGWGEKAIELRSVETGNLEGVFMHKKAQKLKFLCERNDKVFFASVQSGGSSQIYFMTLGQNVLFNW
ncbi:hypothetical protein LUU34_00771400 [Aix galericulata]|nr:hypothetical protein LUU34_00771400 [Aix galericulata]